MELIDRRIGDSRDRDKGDSTSLSATAIGTTSDQESLRPWLVKVTVVIGATIIESVAGGTVAILFPITLEELGYRSSAIVAFLALESAMAICLGFRLASVVRRIGSGKGLVLATLVQVGALVLLSRDTSLPSWIIGVAFYGAGAFMFVQLLQTWIATIQTTRRGLLIGVFGTAVSLGMALGPVVLGILPEALTALGGRSPFVASALISAAALLPILPILRHAPVTENESAPSFAAMVRRTPATLCAVAVAGITLFAVTDFLAIYGLRHGLALQDAAFMLSSFLLGCLMLEAPIASLSDWLDRRYVIAALVLLGMVCAGYLPLAIYTPVHAWTLLFLWGGVTGGLYSVTLAHVTEQSRGCQRVAVNSAYSLTENLGGTAGTLTIGLSMDMFGSDGLPCTIILAGAVYFAYSLYRAVPTALRRLAIASRAKAHRPSVAHGAAGQERASEESRSGVTWKNTAHSMAPGRWVVLRTVCKPA